MSGLTAWLWGTSQLDDAIDKATSELLPAGSEDIALNLEICDQIRSKSIPAKDAMRGLKRRLNHKNPNVQLLALGLTDICVKNGGDHFLVEIASREFVDNLVSILKIPGLNHEVKNNILRFIQNWSIAFEGRYALGYVGQVYKTLQGEGYKFPPKDLAVTSSAMVDTQTAPEWIDSDVCLRCRTAFTFTNRKHHCRNCGQVFDHQCSSKSLPLPHFGITQEVRVCDGCHTKLTRKTDKVDKRHRSSHSVPNPSRHRSAQELADAELQRAIELSLQENKSRGYAPSYSTPSSWQPSEPPIVDNSTYSDTKTIDEDDPDLKAAIEASLREANAPQPSAPVVMDTPKIEQQQYSYQPQYVQPQPPTPTQPPLPKLPTYDLDPLETDAILTFNQTVEQVQANGGRDLSRYPAVTELYEKASGLRPKLALSADDAGRKEQMLSEMHDKLSEAVKLYDQILTEQVMHPRWRTNLTRSPQQQYQTAPSNPGYNQQAPSQTPIPQALPPQSPSIQYAPQTPQSRPEYQQSQPQRQWTYPGQAQSAQQYLTSQTPVPVPQQITSPSPRQQTQQIQPLAPAPPPPQATAYVPAPPIMAVTPAPPVPSTPVQPQPTPQVAYNQVAPSAPPPAMYNVNQQPQQQNQGAQLGRSNTLAHPGYHQQYQPQYGMSPPPNTMPQFPLVPTTAPMPMYEPTRHNGVAQSEERKDALLIDL
ncbi:ubiquitin binding protein [Macrolepiota fuliginosa MF-IS2]|uniref:Vacuolar protein sorting-associated protein 27 n=1 Tax=Macrolepiota fuliginosa MF-IS2 TaxID=1400762 RepID=A0A9P5XBY1_9AGAR|nr:ubiquitin binding protein [Macrolepiota fuliginosa MF-IS2]